MIQPKGIELDLALALRRIEADYQHGRAFVRRPYELKLIASVRQEWLAGLAARLVAGTFAPTAAPLTNVPKGAGGVRPAALLSLEDQVVYTALLGAALPQMLPTLQWIAPAKDYAYQLRKPATTEWVSAPFWCWEKFRERSVALVDAGAAMVVSTDITGCYEHIDHATLISDLRACGVTLDVLTLLSTCLGRWCCLGGRGLPQNMTASHLLAKLYLGRVDRALADAGFKHVRYVDDFRIFCGSKAEAKRALLTLAVVLRDRGLTLQTAKTKMLPPAEARAEFEGIAPVLKPMVAQFIKDIAAQAGVDAAYMTVTEAEALVAQGSAEIPTQMLRAAYDVHFMDGAEFDRTMFHYLIARLGKATDPFALDHALSLLESHPEETEYILRYAAQVGAVATADDKLVQYLRSEAAVYDYQTYQFLQWRTAQPEVASEAVVGFARTIAAADNTASHVRAVARGLLGRFGTDADLDDLIRRYGTAGSELERAEIVCALSRVERGRRNAFLGRSQNDGFLVAAAIAAVRVEVDWYAT